MALSSDSSLFFFAEVAAAESAKMRLASSENVMSTGMGPAKKFSVMVKFAPATICPATSPWNTPLSEFHLASASSWKLTMIENDLNRSICWTAPGLLMRPEVLSVMVLRIFVFLSHCCSIVLRGYLPQPFWSDAPPSLR